MNFYLKSQFSLLTYQYEVHIFAHLYHSLKFHSLLSILWKPYDETDRATHSLIYQFKRIDLDEPENLFRT